MIQSGGYEISEFSSACIESCASFAFIEALLGSSSSHLRDSGINLLYSHLSRSSLKLSQAGLSAYLNRLFDYARIRAVEGGAYARRVGVGILEGLAHAVDQLSVERRIGVLNFLRDVLEVDRSTHYSPSCVQVVTLTLGRLSRTIMVKAELQLLEERYLRTSLEWIQDMRYEARRYAAALVLSELTINVPTLILDARGSIHARVWGALSDTSSRIREVVACAARSFLSILYHRDDSLDASIYFQHAALIVTTGLLTNCESNDQVHGALLLLAAVLQRHPCDKSLIIDDFDDVLPGKYWRQPLLGSGTLEAWFQAVLGVRGLQATDTQLHVLSVALLPSLACIMAPVLTVRHGVIQSILKTIKTNRALSISAAVSRCTFVITEILDTNMEASLVYGVVKRMVTLSSKPRAGPQDSSLALPIVRSFTVLIRMIGEYNRHHLTHFTNCGELHDQIRKIFCFLVPQCLTRTMFHLIKAIHAHFPSLRSSVQHYVLDQVASTITACTPVGMSGAGSKVRSRRGPRHEVQSMVASYSKFPSYGCLSSHYCLRREAAKVEFRTTVNESMPCLAIYSFSKIRFSMGVLFKFDFFECQQTKGFSALLMEVAAVLAARVVSLAPMISLEASIYSWKLLAKMPYLEEISHPALYTDAPLAFLHAVVEYVMLETLGQRAELRCIILNSFPPSCDTILALPRLLRVLFSFSVDNQFLVRKAAVQLMSRLVTKAPSFVLPRIGRCLARQLERMKHCNFISSRVRNGSLAVQPMECYNTPDQDSYRSALPLCEITDGAIGALELVSLALDRGQRMLAPYVPAILPIVAHLLARAKVDDAIAPIAACVTGKITLIFRDGVLPIARKVIPKVVCVLCAQPVRAPRLRYVAARALEHLVSSTGDILTPYCFSAPRLVDTLLHMLKDQRSGQDIQAFRTLGVLGALDPPFLLLLREKEHPVWPHVFSFIRTTEVIAAADQSNSSNQFRNYFKLETVKAVQTLGSAECKTVRGEKFESRLPTGELLQASAMIALLDAVLLMPQVRKEAFEVLSQVCSWLAPDALTLRAVLGRHLCILSSGSRKMGGARYGQRTARPVCLDERSFVRKNINQSSHCMQNSGSVNVCAYDIDFVRILVSSLIRILELIDPSIIMAECCSGRLAAAISILWPKSGHSAKHQVCTTSASCVTGESLINVMRCLHSRLSLHNFVSQMRWLLSPLRSTLTHGSLYPCLHIIDSISDSLIMSGNAKMIIVTILNVFAGLFRLLHDDSFVSRVFTTRSVEQNHKTQSRTASEICIVLVSVIRLISRVGWSSVLPEIAPQFIKSMLDCIAIRCDSMHKLGMAKGLDSDNKVQLCRDAPCTPKLKTSHYLIMVSELAIYGLTIISGQIGRSALSRLSHSRFALSDWVINMEHLLMELSSPAVETIFGNSGGPNYVMLAAHAALAAYDGYNVVVSAISRGKPTPSPTQGCAVILRENFDNLFADMLSPTPFRIRQMRDKYPYFKAKVYPLNQCSQDPPLPALRPDNYSARAGDDHIIDLAALNRVWDSAGVVTRGDWTEWMHRISVELLRQSPSPYLRPCSAIADACQTTAYRLFKPGFLAMWIGCGFAIANCFGGPAGVARRLVKSLGVAMCSCSLSLKSLWLLFDLVDFARMYCAPLPIELPMMARRACQAHAHARALAARENYWRLNSKIDPCADDVIAALVTSNNNLGLKEAAAGILLVRGPSSRLKPQLQEQLGCWDAALAIYERCLPSSVLFPVPSSKSAGQSEPAQQAGSRWLDMEVGRLRCHSALFDHRTVMIHARYLWSLLTSSLNRFPGPLNFARKLDGRQNSRIVCVAASHRVREERQEQLIEISALGARASWMLQNWDDLGIYVAYWGACRVRQLDTARNLHVFNSPFRPSTHELFLFQAVLAWKSAGRRIRHVYSALSQAKTLVQAARVQLIEDTKLCTDKSYNHAYYCVMSAQQIFEFEEAVTFESQTLLNLPSSRRYVGTTKVLLSLLAKWKRRVRWWGGLDASVWSNVLIVHKLVLHPGHDIEAFMRLADLCYGSGHFLRCGNVLAFLDSVPQIPSVNVILRACHLLWALGRRALAYDVLSRVTESLIFSHQKNSWDLKDKPGDEILIASILTRSEWCGILIRASKFTRRSRYFNQCLSIVIRLLQRVTKLVPLQPRAWHSWALANYEACEQLERRELHKLGNSGPVLASSPGTVSVFHHVIQSIGGFFRSLQLFGTESRATRQSAERPGVEMHEGDAVVLQDTLRLLTIWFKHGTRSQVSAKMLEGFGHTSVDVWLGVIPQLIARVDYPDEDVRHLVADLLVQVGRAHPQALIYPITVSAQSASESRRVASVGILGGLQQCEYYGVLGDASTQTRFAISEVEVLVAEANLVSRELNRSAITWHEAWYQGIEAAANLYFGSADVQATIHGLIEMHRRWHDDLQSFIGVFPDSSPDTTIVTTRLAAFAHVYSPDLLAAESFLSRFCRLRNHADMHQAWDIYSAIHKWVKQSIFTDKLSHLDLGQVAPSLMCAGSMHVAIPGTEGGRNLPVRILSISPQLRVLASKQRPRCLRISGSDGKEYQFLLKGHEDLRQDERVMQLFGLINALFNKTYNAGHGHKEPLHVQQYVVMPLSNNSGLIGWLKCCSTIHQLIVNHRSHSGILVDIERRFTEAIACDYHKSPFMYKLGDFKYVLNRTYNRDLANVFLVTSGDVSIWLMRRTRYARSLAVTSVVGYVLGLGDRHLSNILVSDKSGEVIHIDFGDCFEVAMKRKRFPEKIPFRLTKLLVNAMEVSGVEGSYRLTCNHTMRVLRNDFHSLMAMLEAFVHDPLVDWKLLSTNNSHFRNVLKQTLVITDRVQQKLTGSTLHDPRFCVSPIHQIDGLIREAQCAENICQMYGGWCPYW